MSTPPAVSTRFRLGDFIPISYWGRDHWSTLAYVETVIVEVHRFEIGRDPAMRNNRRNFRVMAEMCPTPKRPRLQTMAAVMQIGEGSLLNDGTIVPHHDDWYCLRDMAHAGLFVFTPGHNPGLSGPVLGDEIEPSVSLSLSERGKALVAELRAFLGDGGAYEAFVPRATAEAA